MPVVLGGNVEKLAFVKQILKSFSVYLLYIITVLRLS